MAIRYVDGATGATWGATQGTIAGFNLESNEQSFEDPKEMFENASGTPIGFAHGIKEKQVITLSGEITAATDLMASVFGTAITYANAALVGSESIDFGLANTGDFYLETPSISNSRGAWKKVTMTFERWPLITGSSA